MLHMKRNQMTACAYLTLYKSVYSDGAREKGAFGSLRVFQEELIVLQPSSGCLFWMSLKAAITHTK